MTINEAQAILAANRELAPPNGEEMRRILLKRKLGTAEVIAAWEGLVSQAAAVFKQRSRGT